MIELKHPDKFLWMSSRPSDAECHLMRNGRYCATYVRESHCALTGQGPLCVCVWGGGPGDLPTNDVMDVCTV